MGFFHGLFRNVGELKGKKKAQFYWYATSNKLLPHLGI